MSTPPTRRTYGSMVAHYPPQRPFREEPHINYWLVILSMILFMLVLQIIVYYLRRRSSGNHDDDTDDNGLTELDDESYSPTTGRYRDTIDGFISTSTGSTGTHLSHPHPRSRDDPYIAGMSSLLSFDNLEDRRNFRAPVPVANSGEVQRLIGELQFVKSEPENEATKERVRLIQQRITQLVMTDSRYAQTAPRPTPLGPPPSYSDAIQTSDVQSGQS